MLTPQRAGESSAGTLPWAELVERHRERWLEALGGDRDLLWVDDFTAAGDASAKEVRAAAAAGRPVAVGMRADAGGAAGREAARLATELGGVALCQRLAAGSVIVSEEAEAREAGDAVHFLVCVNVDEVAAAAPGNLLDADAAPLLHGYVRYLEEANRALSEANTRLARERLGVQDSAAATLAAELKKQREAAEANYERQITAILSAPRYRAVDGLRALVFRLPGLSKVAHRRSRRIRANLSQD